jgi:hypothetical protein
MSVDVSPLVWLVGRRGEVHRLVGQAERGEQLRHLIVVAVGAEPQRGPARLDVEPLAARRVEPEVRAPVQVQGGPGLADPLERGQPEDARGGYPALQRPASAREPARMSATVANRGAGPPSGGGAARSTSAIAVTISSLSGQAQRKPRKTDGRTPADNPMRCGTIGRNRSETVASSPLSGTLATTARSR